MARTSRLVAGGSWLMAKKEMGARAQGQGDPAPHFLGHEPGALRHEKKRPAIRSICCTTVIPWFFYKHQFEPTARTCPGATRALEMRSCVPWGRQCLFVRSFMSHVHWLRTGSPKLLDDANSPVLWNSETPQLADTPRHSDTPELRKSPTL